MIRTKAADLPLNPLAAIPPYAEKQTNRLIKAAKKIEEAARRGPKPTGNAKQLITLRLDPDVLAHYRGSGDGWQSRINAALRTAAGL